MHEQHKASQEDQHHQGVVERGDQVMGFSHVKTAHHFRLYSDGGAIEAEASDAQDTVSVMPFARISSTSQHCLRRESFPRQC